MMQQFFTLSTDHFREFSALVAVTKDFAQS